MTPPLRAERWFVAAAMLLCLAVAWPQAQSPEPQLRFRSGVDLMQVDVTVLDKDRKPVRDLAAADFTIKEDGKVRPVVAFTPVDRPGPPATPALARWTRDAVADVVSNEVAREGRLVTIVFDRTIRPEDMKTARTIATKVVDELDAGDLAALVFTSQFSNGGKAVDFTTDRARLRAAIQAPFVTAAHASPQTMALEDPDNLLNGDCLCGVCVLKSLTRIADAVRDVSGRRKLIVFVSSYVRVMADMNEGAVRMGTQNPMQAVCPVMLKDAREQLMRATGLANVMLYSFDAVGLESAMNSPLGEGRGAIIKRQANFKSLADTLGGRNIMNTNTPEVFVRSVLDESSLDHLLGFEPQARSDGRDHKIEVAVSRRGVTVQTRKAYVAPLPEPAEETAEAKPAAITSPTMAAVTGVLPKTGLALSLGVASFASPDPKAKGLTTVTVLVERPAPAGVGAGGARAEIAVAAFDRRGQSVAVAHQPVNFVGTAGGGRLRYEVVSHLALEPGHYDLRVGASDDGVTDAGSVFTTIDVPDYRGDRLSMAEPLLWLPGSDAGASNDVVASLLPVRPTARRAFAAADRVSALMRVYQGGGDQLAPVTVRTRLMDTSDTSRFDVTLTLAPEQFASGRSADHQFALPLAGLARGEYLLRIEATLEKHVVRRDVRFTVK